MEDGTGIFPGLPAVAGKPVHVGFDNGRLTSDCGILLLAVIEQRLKISERLAACIEDPRDPERVGRDDPLLSRAPSLDPVACLASVRGRHLAAI